MAYTGLVVRLENHRKDPNSDNLYLAEVFGEGVIVGSNMKDGIQFSICRRTEELKDGSETS